MTKSPITPEEATSLYGEPAQAIHIDFNNTKIGNPVEYDAVTGIEAPFKPTGCISAAEAVAAANGWDARRKREWADIIQAEIEAPAGPSEEHILAMRRQRLESQMQGCVGDLYRLSRRLQNMEQEDTEAMLSNLNHLHMQAGNVLRDIEALAGRSFVPPHVSYNTLRLHNMGGYSTDPRTGQRMCPISHYREPWPEGADNSRVTPPFEQV